MDLLQMSLSGAWLILAAAVFRAAAGRRTPKSVFLALWWAAVVRLLLPVETPSRFSVYTLLQALRPVPAAPVLTTPSITGNPVMILPPVSPVEVPATPAPFPVKTAVWLTGAALLALGFLVNYVRWRRRFRESLPVESAFASRWRMKRPRIQVRVSDRILAPLTYGLLHPVILLPKGMDLSDENALLCVLTHEEIHIRRFDGLLKLLLAAALCVHWFNPVVWLLYVLANQDMELRCDEAVLSALGRDSRELYALTLIRMAENRHMPLCGFSRKNGMEERIIAIMNFKKKSTLTWAIALLLAACITTVFATSAMSDGVTLHNPSNETENPDAQFLAEISAENAAMWDEKLSPYVPFGLTYEFDDPDLDGDGLKMYYENHEVRGIFDERNGVWISEHSGNGTYGADAVELYTTYDETGLTGLRLATKEEQAAFTETREQNSDERALQQLYESVRFENDVCYFTVPERDGRWNIWISGRAVTEAGTDVNIRYLETESEKGEWVPGQTYSFTETSREIAELSMEASLNDAKATFTILTDSQTGRPIDFGSEVPLVELPASKGDVPEGIAMVWPTDGDWKSAVMSHGPSSAEHNGVDIAGMERGAPVYAAAAGTVEDAGFNAQDGNYVRLDHGNGLETFYAHCQSLRVKTGDTVTLGQTIAAIGSTGRSTGPHLHFEILVNGEPQDPAAYYQAGFSDYTAWAESVAAREPVDPEAKKELVERLILWAEETLIDGEYPCNKNGQTYAPNEGLTSLVGAPPDLVGAKATNGRYGYVALAELPGSLQIVYGTRVRVSDPDASNPRSLPVYDEEGEVIGEFLVEAG